MDGLNSSGSATLAESDIEQKLPCLRPLLGSVAKLTDASSDYSPAQVTCSMQRYQLQVSFCRKTALGSIESCLTQHMHEDLEGTLGFLRARLYSAMPLRAGLSRWLSHYEIDAIQSALSADMQFKITSHFFKFSILYRTAIRMPSKACHCNLINQCLKVQDELISTTAIAMDTNQSVILGDDYSSPNNGSIFLNTSVRHSVSLLVAARHAN